MNNGLQMVFVKSVENKNTVLSHVQEIKEEHQQCYILQQYKLWMFIRVGHTPVF